MLLRHRIRILLMHSVQLNSSISIVCQRTTPPPKGRIRQFGRKKLPSYDRKSFTNPSNLKRFMQLLFSSITLTQIGGDDRDRTGDPLLAKQVLSQLSYIPPPNISVSPHLKMVGLTGVEPVTSPLSGARSNQLSYRPNPVWRRPRL